MIKELINDILVATILIGIGFIISRFSAKFGAKLFSFFKVILTFFEEIINSFKNKKINR